MRRDVIWTVKGFATTGLMPAAPPFKGQATLNQFVTGGTKAGRKVRRKMPHWRESCCGDLRRAAKFFIWRKLLRFTGKCAGLRVAVNWVQLIKKFREVELRPPSCVGALTLFGRRRFPKTLRQTASPDFAVRLRRLGTPLANSDSSILTV